MAWKLSNFIFSCVVMYGLIGELSEALNCGNDPCRCDVSEDQFLNVSDLQGNFTSGNLVYYFSGCRNVNKENCYDTTLCLEEKQTGNKSVWTSLGNQKNMKIEPSKIGTGYDIIYSLPGVTSRVGLVCTETFDETFLWAKNISDKMNPVLYVFSKNACLHLVPHRKGMSTGSTLVVLFLVGCTLYFVGGAVVLYCIRGARGREMIPNIDFWQNLPGLMKDGMIFVLNGCRPTAVPTAESYDRI